MWSNILLRTYSTAVAQATPATCIPVLAGRISSRSITKREVGKASQYKCGAHLQRTHSGRPAPPPIPWPHAAPAPCLPRVSDVSRRPTLQRSGQQPRPASRLSLHCACVAMGEPIRSSFSSFSSLRSPSSLPPPSHALRLPRQPGDE